MSEGMARMVRLADGAEVDDYESVARAELPGESDNFIVLACCVMLIADQLGQALDRIDQLTARLSKLDGE